MGTTLDQLKTRLKPFGQDHLLAFWDKLDDAGRQSLAGQIENVDLELVGRLAKGGQRDEAWADLAQRASPPSAIRLADRTAERVAEAQRRGSAALAAGEVGVLVVAGGQGTRLGFEHPKGMYPIGPVSHAPLFRILIEKVLARGRAAGVRMPLYLMTSPATDRETVDYLASERNFGLPDDDLRVFCQGTMPAAEAQSGKLLLANRGSLSLSPDGHGGMLAALVRSGTLADAKARGIRYLFYAQIDNPLVAVGDPEFLGHHLVAGSELSSQVVAKRAIRDKVGNVVTIDGALRIIEYSDLNPLGDEIVDRRLPDGAPVFWAGSIAVHVFDVDFLERMAKSADALPFHLAHKAVPYVDPASGQRIEPAGPNAIKFERFIFDLLPAAERAIVVEVDWARAFAPVKNAPGDTTDTPEATQSQMIALHREWLEQAGARVAADVPVEICPLFAQDAGELKARVSPGLTVTQARYFC
jgi:UDP-N-acetylglucosamine/UDP-N-acetylgalactosamine diphosphorylase